MQALVDAAEMAHAYWTGMSYTEFESRWPQFIEAKRAALASKDEGWHAGEYILENLGSAVRALKATA